MKSCQMLDFVDDSRNNLDGTGTGSNNGHSLSSEITFSVPPSGVEFRTLETINSRNRGYRRGVELSDTDDNNVGLKGRFIGASYGPLLGSLIPHSFLNFLTSQLDHSEKNRTCLVEADFLADIVLCDNSS